MERSRARPWCGAEGSDGRAGVGGGAAAALATGLDASKENGVAALLRLKAIMEATVRQSPFIPHSDLSLFVEFARGLRVRYESLALGLYLDFARVLTKSQDWRVQAFAF